MKAIWSRRLRKVLTVNLPGNQTKLHAFSHIICITRNQNCTIELYFAQNWKIIFNWDRTEPIFRVTTERCCNVCTWQCHDMKILSIQTILLQRRSRISRSIGCNEAYLLPSLWTATPPLEKNQRRSVLLRFSLGDGAAVHWQTTAFLCFHSTMDLAQVVQRVDRTILWLNHYPLDNRWVK